MIGFIATLATKFEAIFTHLMIAFFAGANTIIKACFADIVIDTHYALLSYGDLFNFSLSRAILLYIEENCPIVLFWVESLLPQDRKPVV
jgi:hypothetical protein